MSTARTPTLPTPLLTAAQQADFEHACEELGINPEKRLAEWRIDTMSLGKHEVDLFVRQELEKLINEAQGLEPLGDGATALGPKGPADGTRKKRKSAPQDLLTRLRAAVHEVGQHVTNKSLGSAKMSLEKAEATLHDLINVLEGNVMDKLMEPHRADEMSLEASGLFGTAREAVDLLKKQEVARQKEAAFRGAQREEDQERFHDAVGEQSQDKKSKEQSKKDGHKAGIEAARLQLQALRENCELAIREAARSSEAVNKERLSLVHAKADALKKAALSAAAWLSGNR